MLELEEAVRACTDGLEGLRKVHNDRYEELSMEYKLLNDKHEELRGALPSRWEMHEQQEATVAPVNAPPAADRTLKPTSVSSGRAVKPSLTSYFEVTEEISYQKHTSHRAEHHAGRINVEQPTAKSSTRSKIVGRFNNSWIPSWLSGDEPPWLTHHAIEHTMPESVWSLPLVIGLLPVGRASSLMLLSLTVLNTVIQVT